MSKNRLIYLDLLRTIACFSVIVLHTSASNWHKSSVESFSWQVFNFYDGLVRFCVPVFVMISGVFFLDPEREFSLDILFQKYILRIIKAFVFWSASYSILINIFKYKAINVEFLLSTLKQFMVGRYHLWFLFMIFALYLVAPFLRKITCNKNLLEYFIILFLIFGILIPFLQKLPLFEQTTEITDKMNLYMVLGFSGYFVIGYYLVSYELSQFMKRVIYIMGCLGILLTIVFTSIISLMNKEPTEVFYDYLSPNVLTSSIALFLFFKERVAKHKFSERTITIILRISRYTFGIYLVHDFFNILFWKIGLTTLLFNPLGSVPLISSIIFALSFLVVALIDKIPFLRRNII